MSRRQPKSFLIQQFFKNVGEVWASSPHLRSKRNFAISGFPAAIALFETSQFGIGCFYETSCKFRQGNGAIAARWQAKAGVEPPFAGCERPFFLRAGFSVKHFRCNCSTGTVVKCLLIALGKQGGAVLFAMSLT